MNRFPNRLTSAVLRQASILVAAGALTLSAAPSPAASSGFKAANGGAAILPPGSNPFGSPYSQWSARFWQWSLGLQLAQNPPFGGAPCTSGQSGHVWFLYGGPAIVNCTVPNGTALYFPIIDAECSNLDPAPYHGETPAERGSCAKAWIDNATDLSATIDGVPVRNLALYRVQSGDFQFFVPRDNILGITGPAMGLSSDDGYYLMLAPRSTGNHTIRIHAVQHDPSDPSQVAFIIDTTINLTVAE
jgi:hypothetical protein